MTRLECLQSTPLHPKLLTQFLLLIHIKFDGLYSSWLSLNHFLDVITIQSSVCQTLNSINRRPSVALLLPFLPQNRSRKSGGSISNAHTPQYKRNYNLISGRKSSTCTLWWMLDQQPATINSSNQYSYQVKTWAYYKFAKLEIIKLAIGSVSKLKHSCCRCRRLQNRIAFFC